MYALSLRCEWSCFDLMEKNRLFGAGNSRKQHKDNQNCYCKANALSV